MTRFRQIPLLLAVTVAAAFPATSDAQQQDSAVTDTMFLRARRLVADGNGAAGRALADSLLAAATPGTLRYAEALFWRASVAPTAAAAERDYRMLSIEYPLSPRAEDALLRLAQLELARGDRALALKHLERLTLEHPASAARARASYWRSRVLFEDGNVPRACAALADARTHVTLGDVELRNQVEFQSRRCLGVDTTVVAEAPRPAAPVPPPPPVTPSVTPPATTTPARTPATVPATPRAAASLPFTVQVAAFPGRAQADQFRDRLVARGIDARTVGAGQVFRVRVGRYATRATANTVAQDLRARKIAGDAFVTEAEAQ
jgi:cell division septation protein DedD